MSSLELTIQTMTRLLLYFTNNIYLFVYSLKVDKLSFFLDKAFPKEKGLNIYFHYFLF